MAITEAMGIALVQRSGRIMSWRVRWSSGGMAAFLRIYGFRPAVIKLRLDAQSCHRVFILEWRNDDGCFLQQ